MSYFGEFRVNSRPLIGAALGSGVGIYLLAYIGSVFSPHLIAEFQWSRSQFALLGLTAIGSLLIIPVMGRAADLLGTRSVALLGVVGMPLCFLAFSQMDGSFAMFMAINAMILFIGAATSPVVYTRIVAQRFLKARGLALTIITCAPALVGALGTPAMNAYISSYGWRAGYVLLAAAFATIGVLAMLLVGSGDRIAPKAKAGSSGTPVRYGPALRSRPFLVIAGAMILCSVPACLHTSQMQLMLLDNGLSIEDAAWMITLYASGTVVGRISCGLALDRFPSHIVSALSMGLPTIGLAVLASNLDGVPWIAFAMLLVGLSQGAEGDIVAFLVAKWFHVDIYSSVLGVVFMCTGGAVTFGAVILSVTLRYTDTFAWFVGVTAVTVLLGGLLFYLLGEPEESPSKNDDQDALSSPAPLAILPG